MPYDAKVGDLVGVTTTVTDVERDTKGPFVSQFTIKGALEAEETTPPPPGTRLPGFKRSDNGRHSSPQLTPPDIREVRKGQKAYDDFKFDDFSAIKIAYAEGKSGYIFFVNMDNRFLIHELHNTKQEEGGLVKHWFKYGVVLSALGILKEQQRQQEERETEQNGGPESLDLEKVGQFCAGLARVVVPMIRALYKGPAMLQAAVVAS
jgi:hypothetical protein